ncbi:hypothetical protein NFJ07_02985 [Arthrobacter sp. B2a2-09]|uniref:hypothetical protein n=1 Tax=Arthrobacter sp. B2a2-09 TaxID=2952822 RepID=UPI0022CDB5FC|nr:hypothetical protein [Arthrobacter sp. B2a2-09]MCZ9880747.1 hypothetical protein [Arthrobacter sp. B2a2-09]
MRTLIKTAILVGAICVSGIAVTAATLNVPPSISTASDVVPAFLSQQAESDKLPDTFIATFAPTGANLTDARFLGDGPNARYFAVTRGSDKICIATVGKAAEPLGLACTNVKGFEGYGLRVGNDDHSDQAWLISPHGAAGNTLKSANAVATTSKCGQWKQIASNLLVLAPSNQ